MLHCKPCSVKIFTLGPVMYVIFPTLPRIFRLCLRSFKFQVFFAEYLTFNMYRLNNSVNIISSKGNLKSLSFFFFFFFFCLSAIFC